MKNHFSFLILYFKIIFIITFKTFLFLLKAGAYVKLEVLNN